MRLQKKHIVHGTMAFMGIAFLFFLHTGIAFSAPQTGLQTSASAAGFDTNVNLQKYIGYGIQAILSIVGAAFFAILVYGGILWMFSDGEQGKITKARGMIFYAVAGLFIVLGAFAITNFITEQIAVKALK